MPTEDVRVLVVDDDDLVRLAMVEQLKDAGCECFELPSAIGVTRSILHNQVQVVVIDILMPSMPGDKLAKLLRDNARLSKLGVILVSGGGDSVRLEYLGAEVGADAVLEKGRIDELGQVVHRVYRRVRDQHMVS